MEIKLEKKKYVLAISGGVDSMVLLDLLVKNNYEVVLAHFNHLTRDEENTKDYELIKKYAKKYNLKVYYREYDFSNSKENFHSLAHKKRYEFFYEILKEENCDLLLAHHGQDLIETNLMAYLRGSSLKGYAAFSYDVEFHEYKIYRPLVYYLKTDIVKYAQENNVIFNEDYSNQKDSYTRNRLRHHVIPLLLEETDSAAKKAIQYANTLLEANDYIEKQALKYLVNGWHVDTFKELHPILKKAIIANTLKEHNINTSNIIIDSIISMCDAKEGTKSFDLSNNYILVKSYNDIYLRQKITKDNTELSVTSCGDYYFGNKHIIVQDVKALSNNNYLEMCYNVNNNFLIKIRHRKNGDVLEYSYGHKKLKALMIDKKVDKNLRDDLMVIELNNQIIYVEGLYKNTLDSSNKTLYLYIGEKENVE